MSVCLSVDLGYRVLCFICVRVLGKGSMVNKDKCWWGLTRSDGVTSCNRLNLTIDVTFFLLTVDVVEINLEWCLCTGVYINNINCIDINSSTCTCNECFCKMCQLWNSRYGFRDVIYFITTEKLDEEIHWTTTPQPIRAEDTVMPILLIACDRTTVSRSLDLLIRLVIDWLYDWLIDWMKERGWSI